MSLSFLLGPNEFPVLREEVERGLHQIGSIISLRDGVRVTTQCLYPSNGLVRITVRGGSETIVASDEGEAVGEALAAGIELTEPDRLLRSIVREQGLLITNGIIHTPKLPIDTLPVAIIQAANAAKDVANWLYDHNRLKRRNDFRKSLSAFLMRTYDKQVAEARIAGASNKQHRFANVVSFANGRMLIVDAVGNDASSINSRVVANLDVRSVNNPKIEQRIVYDDAERWSAADLNLLQVGATVVPFSKAPDVIRRVAEKTSVA